MKKLWQVGFRVSGLGAEKLLNEIRKQNISLFKAERQADRSLLLCCAPRDYARIRALGEEKGFSVSNAEKLGLYGVFSGLLRRPGLLAGLGVSLALLLYSMGFIWQIRVENAGAYRGEVLMFLEEAQISPGLRRKDISPLEIQEQLEWRLPQVKWVRVKYDGVALVIRLEEGVPPPGVETEGEAGDVVAQADGLLTRLTVYAGTPAAEAGDYVRKGQVLIRGEERGKNGKSIPVRARGEAIARLWIASAAKSPLTEQASFPTGREYERRVIQTPLFSFSFQDPPAYLTYDLEIEEHALGGTFVPLILQKEKYLEAAMEIRARDMEEAKAEAARLALISLQKKIQNYEMVDKWIEFSMIKGDTVVATATAEIRRDIAAPQNN